MVMKMQYVVACILAGDSSLVLPERGLEHGEEGRGHSLSQGLSGAGGFSGRGGTGGEETIQSIG